MIIVLSVLLAIPAVDAFAKKEGKAESNFRHELRDKVKAYHDEQQKENKEFRESLKDLDPEERSKAVVEHNHKRHQESKEFMQNVHQERMEHLKERLNNSEKLTDAQRQEVLGFAEQQYKDASSFWEQQHKESAEFIGGLDPNMSKKERAAAIKAHRAQQQKENKAFREKAREARKAKFKELKEEVKDALDEASEGKSRDANK